MNLKPFQIEALKLIDDTQDGVPVRRFMEIAEERGEDGMSVCTALNNLLSSCIVNAEDMEETLQHLRYVVNELTKARDAVWNKTRENIKIDGKSLQHNSAL